MIKYIDILMWRKWYAVAGTETFRPLWQYFCVAYIADQTWMPSRRLPRMLPAEYNKTRVNSFTVAIFKSTTCVGTKRTNISQVLSSARTVDDQEFPRVPNQHVMDINTSTADQWLGSVVQCNLSERGIARRWRHTVCCPTVIALRYWIARRYAKSH